MTFNTWVSGDNVENGMFKIAHHIKLINPDIVALQEISSRDHLNHLISLLNDEWTGVASTYAYTDTAILTKHEIVNESFHQISHGLGVGIRINSTSRTIHIWNLHLDYQSYGPHAAFNKMVTRPTQIMAGEMHDGKGRFQNMRELLVDDHFQAAVENSLNEPLIVCGDFNSPSHLDWTNETSFLHGDWHFQWPATKMLQDEAKMKDSYREVHPEVLKNLGITWSTVEKMTSSGWSWTIPEPQDRIDYIFYRSPLLSPVQSFTYQGHATVYPKPFHWKNDYPSDHFAVITIFILK
uniref:Endonuclease/exonuclease/phosphatase domain-containing protein n=1 Tax=Setaria digitata TaxID=48799 RepID=A0A915PJG9_9BILA